MMDATHFEAARRGNINDFPFCEINDQDSSEIFHKFSPLGNSLLHVAAGSGHLEITELMASKFPFMITKKNSQGNTPLHFAVKAEKLNTTKVLVECAKQIGTSDTLLRMKNDEGNTALHMVLLELKAAEKGRVDNLVAVACYLVSENPEVSYVMNNASKSPLLLAIESNNVDILDYLLSALPEDAGLLDTLQGKNPVHVAIEKNQLDILGIIKKKKEELLVLKDDEENTPLHYAASIGYLEGVNYLLEINNNWAFERNKKGLYPLHLACENGHAKIMKKLLEKWPDATEFLCNRDRSILHVVAMCGKEEMVSYILKEKTLDELVNKKDKDGNTPLHLAALSCNPLVVATLLYHKRSKLDLVNNQGLTAYDLFNLKESQKVQDQGIDVNVGNLRETYDKDSSEMDFKRYDEPNRFQKMATSVLFYKKKKSFYPKNDYSSITKVALAHIKSKERLSKEDVNSRINILFVVAALIVGSAYAGSLQMLDGGKSDDVGASHANTTIRFVKSNITDKAWESKYGFPRHWSITFVFDNVAAMSLSITAAFALCSALLLEDMLATILIKIAFSCLVFALSFMAKAFLSAINIGMQTYEIHSWDIELVRVVLQLSQWLLVTIPLMILAFGGEALTRHTLSIFFSIYFRLHRLWRKVQYLLNRRINRRIAKYGRRILVGFFILFLFLFLVLYIMY